MNWKTHYLPILFVVIGLIVACSEEQTASRTPESITRAPESTTANRSPTSSMPAVSDAQTQTRRPSSSSSGSHSGVVEGVVTDLSGNPVAGAFVKMRNGDRRLLFMVISQDGGRYMADRLPSGSYVVQSVGGDYQSAWSEPANVTNGAATKVDLTLDGQRGPDHPAAWPRHVPASIGTMDHIPDGPGKDIIAKNCSVCHSPDEVAGRRQTAEEWARTVEDMSERRWITNSYNPRIGYIELL